MKNWFALNEMIANANPSQSVPFWMAEDVPESVPQRKPGATKELIAPPAPEPMTGVSQAALSQRQVMPFLMPGQAAEDADLRGKFKDALNKQELGLDALELRRNQFAAEPQGPNLVPLAAFADSFGGGSNLAEAAKSMAPMRPEERAAMIAKLDDQIQGRRENVTREVAQRLRDNSSHKLMADMARQNRFEAGQDFKLTSEFNRNLISATKGLDEILPSFGAVEDALRPNANGKVNAQRVQQALSNAARIMGEKGVLTDQDTARIQAKNLESLAAQISNFVTGPEAEVNVSMIAPLIAGVQAGKRSWIDTVKKKVDRTKNQYVASGLSPERASAIADGVFQQGYLDKVSAAPPAQGGNGVDDFLREMGGK